MKQRADYIINILPLLIAFDFIERYRLIKEYAGEAAPQFIEGAGLKLSLPVLQTEDEGLRSVLKAIQSNPGIQANKISALLNNRPIKTIERPIYNPFVLLLREVF